jgi:N-acyl-L-homoserine lactone synthetase
MSVRIAIRALATDGRQNPAALTAYFDWLRLIFPGPTEAGRMRFDAYDGRRARHLVALADGAVVGGARLIPPGCRSPSADAMRRQGLVSEPRRDAFDWSRVFVVPAHRRGLTPGSVLSALFCGAMEFALSHEARLLGGLVETVWLDYFRAAGWRPEIVGLPWRVRGRMQLLAFVPVSAEALEAIRWTADIAGPVLIDDGPPPLDGA